MTFFLHSIAACRLAVLALLLLGLAHCPPLRAAQDLRYVGSERCIACHQAQGQAWRQSHHARAMQAATATTVLGRFDGTVLDHHGQLTRFFRRDGRFFVNTAGADGQARDYAIAYTFGVHPLQQYLIELPGGRLQALGVAWDARPETEGGQRWFHLYADAPPPPGDSLHWTGRDQNWNFMCASCHSTGLRKGYDAAKDRYRSAWSEMPVACEACHGAGSAHVAKFGAGRKGAQPPGSGLAFAGSAPVPFGFRDGEQKIASPLADPGPGRAVTDACLACHSRRQELLADADKKGGEAGWAFLDRFLPTLIEQGAYHADGQVDGEVFEGASFLQSAMHRAGVACTHCHETHSLRLRASGNALCVQCHRADEYDRPAHHRHGEDSAGSRCVACHMPGKTFMGVHVRHDHSLRIPQPGLSQRFGTPDACAACHADKPAGWAAGVTAGWRSPRKLPRWPTEAAVSALDGEWRGRATGVSLQAALDGELSGPFRASLLARMPADGDPRGLALLARGARDADGWVRLGAVRGLAGQADPRALAVALPLLSDPLRAVRVEAARTLAGVPDAALTVAQQKALTQAIAELIRAETASADRPESRLNLADIQRRLGRVDLAETELQAALRLSPDFVPALVNLADLYRQSGRDKAGEPLLRRAVALDPKGAEPAFALGLLLVRDGRRGEAAEWLRRAAALAPEEARYRRAAEAIKTP